VGAAALGAAIGVPRLLEVDAVDPSAGEPSASHVAPATDEVRALFGTLEEGSAISTHWRLESVHAVRAGAIPVVMSTIYGGRFALEIFRDEADGPTPIARARGLALHLLNHGDGSSRTAELNGLGVMALGRALEERRAEGAPLPSGLDTYRRRTARDPEGIFDIPVGETA
jgi:hypothetical protein